MTHRVLVVSVLHGDVLTVQNIDNNTQKVTRNVGLVFIQCPHYDINPLDPQRETQPNGFNAWNFTRAKTIGQMVTFIHAYTDKTTSIEYGCILFDTFGGENGGEAKENDLAVELIRARLATVVPPLNVDSIPKKHRDTLQLYNSHFEEVNRIPVPRPKRHTQYFPNLPAGGANDEEWPYIVESLQGKTFRAIVDVQEHVKFYAIVFPSYLWVRINITGIYPPFHRTLARYETLLFKLTHQREVLMYVDFVHPTEGLYVTLYEGGGVDMTPIQEPLLKSGMYRIDYERIGLLPDTLRRVCVQIEIESKNNHVGLLWQSYEPTLKNVGVFEKEFPAFVMSVPSASQVELSVPFTGIGPITVTLTGLDTWVEPYEIDRWDFEHEGGGAELLMETKYSMWECRKALRGRLLGRSVWVYIDHVEHGEISATLEDSQHV
eukprot:PhF_6_TR44225/c0_g1_i3/m.67954/K15979/SND1; staphylococcal nuclease domain-containing protein 1